MKSAYFLLAAGFATVGLLAEGCVSGDTVSGNGGQTGNNGTGGHVNTGSGGGSSFGSGGSSFGTGGSNFGTGGSSFGTGGSSGGGVGGSTGGGTGGTTASGPCTVAAADQLIDDFEKPANGVAHACVHGYWYTYNDGSAGTQTPAVNMWMNAPITDRPPSTYAGHSTAMGFTGDNMTPKNIFAGFGLDFNPAPAPSTAKFTANASAFKGITFFAKGSGMITVQLPTPTTDPSLGCVNTTAAPCYDVSSKTIALTAAWTQFNLMWADFAQVGFGAKETLNGSNLGGIKFVSQVAAPATTFTAYDMWIDDLKFIP